MEERRIEGFLSGQMGRISHRKKTYNASDRVRFDSGVGKPMGRHAHEMVVGLMRGTEVIVHGEVPAQTNGVDVR
jgi:hypothetical protein